MASGLSYLLFFLTKSRSVTGAIDDGPFCHAICISDEVAQSLKRTTVPGFTGKLR